MKKGAPGAPFLRHMMLEVTYCVHALLNGDEGVGIYLAHGVLKSFYLILAQTYAQNSNIITGVCAFAFPKGNASCGCFHYGIGDLVSLGFGYYQGLCGYVLLVHLVYEYGSQHGEYCRVDNGCSVEENKT